jgi:hypothetical protein
MLICIVLILFSSMCSVAAFRAFNAGLAQRQISAVRQFVEMVHARALCAGVDCTISIDPDVVILRSDHDYCDVSSDLVWGAPQQSMGPPAHPEVPIDRFCTFVHNEIRCAQSGALSAGTLYCASLSHKHWYALTISVGESSPVRIYEYHAGSWQLV